MAEELWASKSSGHKKSPIGYKKARDPTDGIVWFDNVLLILTLKLNKKKIVYKFQKRHKYQIIRNNTKLYVIFIYQN